MTEVYSINMKCHKKIKILRCKYIPVIKKDTEKEYNILDKMKEK